jgi:asparagine synthase (glutamine-hydrolysing)
MNTYLVDDLLTLSDRMSMQHSLEMRVPFLDHTIVEHFARIEQNYKIHGLSKKYLLKKIAETLLPKELIYRKKKGFSVPLVIWFRGKLKPWVLNILNEQSIRKAGLLNFEFVNKLLNQHFSGRENNDEKIWALMCLMIWYDKYVNKIY